LSRCVISVLMISGVILITRPPFIFHDNISTCNTTDHTLPNNTIDLNNTYFETFKAFNTNDSKDFFGLVVTDLAAAASSSNQHQGKDTNGEVAMTFSPLGYICAILVPLMSAIVSILTRQLRDVHAGVLMFWFGTGALCVATGGKTWSRLNTYIDIPYFLIY